MKPWIQPQHYMSPIPKKKLANRNNTNHDCVCTYNPSTWELEAGGSGIQGYPWLHIKFQASQGYKEPW